MYVIFFLFFFFFFKQKTAYEMRISDWSSDVCSSDLGVARALISGGLTQSLPLKVFYNGPMFRHERPQKGRYRQFHQIGVELLGVAEPLADVEIIALGADILAALGLDRKSTRLNSSH